MEGEGCPLIARELHALNGRRISPTSLAHMVRESAVHCTSGWAMSREPKLRWQGFMLPGKKLVSVRGKPQALEGCAMRPDMKRTVRLDF